MPAGITVVGLGSGDENQLSLGIWRKLKSAEHLYLRTEMHPVVKMLRSNQIAFRTFDGFYEANTAFEDVYEAIAAKLIQLALQLGEDVIYAVPGHPMVAESTVRLLRERCPHQGIDLVVLGGESFLDQAFLRLGFDPVEGFQLIDAGTFRPANLQPLLHTLIAQVYDSFTASDVKLGLMEVYPHDHEVIVGHALGVQGAEQILRVQLFELDRIAGYGNLSLIWVPRSEDALLQIRSFMRLQEIVQILRSPEGCPWDREQTHSSLRRNLIEETCEVLETIDEDDPQAMCEELGDILLQVMLHSQIEDEAGVFNVYDVVAGLNGKLIRRHPHVFGGENAGNAEEATRKWEGVKQAEKLAKGGGTEKNSILSGIPRELPGMMKAWEMQKKAASAGFVWQSAKEAMVKLEEELAELREAVVFSEQSEQLNELGDMLFAAVNLAGLLQIDPEEAIAAANRKFIQRFKHIDEKLRIKGLTFDQTSLSEMEMWWNEAKSGKTN